MLRRAHAGSGGSLSRDVRFDAAAPTSVDESDHHQRNPLTYHHMAARMLLQLLALVGCYLVYIYAISFALSFSSHGTIQSVLPLAAPRLLSMEEAQRLIPNATGAFPLQGVGTLHLPNSCQYPELCVMTLQGEKRLGGSSVPNQDRSLALRVPNHLLLALFDGHGEQGHRAAAEVVRDLPFRILAATKQAKEQPPPATLEAEPVEVPGRQPNVVALPLSSHYTQAFLAADAGPVSKLQYAGTTGIVAHYDAEHQRLVLASVGDSTCLVVKGGGAGGVSPQILMESVKHKPGLPGERKRIESKGGRVFIPLDPVRESSRVLIPGPTGPDSYALAMSRSLGDAEGKELGYLTAEPDVRALELNGLYKQGDHVFVVVASDGVFDVINQQSLIQQLDQAFHSNLLTETCQKLMDEAAQGWNDLTGGIYRDDITLMVAKLPLR